jgi:hypothetical protein
MINIQATRKLSSFAFLFCCPAVHYYFEEGGREGEVLRGVLGGRGVEAVPTGWEGTRAS